MAEASAGFTRGKCVGLTSKKGATAGRWVCSKMLIFNFTTNASAYVCEVEVFNSKRSL